MQFSILKIIIEQGDIVAFTKSKPKHEILFTDTLEVYEAINNFFLKFDEIPHYDDLERYFDNNKSDAHKLLQKIKDARVGKRPNALSLIEQALQEYGKFEVVSLSKEFTNKVKKDGYESVIGNIENFKEQLSDIQNSVVLSEPKHGLLQGETAAEASKRQYELEKRKGDHFIGKYNIPALDDVLGGITKTDYISVMGFVNQAKSPFLRELTYNLLLQGLNIVFVPLETSKAETERFFYVLHANNKKRWGNNIPRITNTKVKNCKLTKKEEEHYFKAIDDFCNAEDMGSLYIIQPEDDLYTMSNMLDDIKRVHKTIMPVDGAVIDYATLLIPSDKIVYADTKQKNIMLTRLRKFQLAFNNGEGLFFINAVQCIDVKSKVLLRVGTYTTIVEVVELKTLLKDNTVEIWSEDGWVTVTDYIDSGVQASNKYTTESGKHIICTDNHLLDSELGMVEAGTLTTDNYLLVAGKLEKIIDISFFGETAVCDLSVDHPNHRFYANDISVHNCNRDGFDRMISHKEHLYDLLAIGEFNSIERDSTVILSTARTLEDEASNQVRLQCLKSRDSKKPAPFMASFDGEVGHYYTTAQIISDDDVVDIIEELEL